MAKAKIGELLCDRCGREVVVKESAGGAYGYTCQHCDFQGYARTGTEARRLLVDEMTKRGSLAALQPGAAAVEQAAPATRPAAGLLMG